jgi:hypothetical protein
LLLKCRFDNFAAHHAVWTSFCVEWLTSRTKTQEICQIISHPYFFTAGKLWLSSAELPAPVAGTLTTFGLFINQESMFFSRGEFKLHTVLTSNVPGDSDRTIYDNLSFEKQILPFFAGVSQTLQRMTQHLLPVPSGRFQ